MFAGQFKESSGKKMVDISIEPDGTRCASRLVCIMTFLFHTPQGPVYVLAKSRCSLEMVAP